MGSAVVVSNAKAAARDLLVRWPRLFDYVKRFSRSLFGYDEFAKALRCIFLSIKEPSVLQIGANDGIRNDPFREYIIQYARKAVLVEPDPNAFSTLKHVYSHIMKSRDVVCLNYAVTGNSIDSCLSYYQLSPAYRRILPKKTQLRISRQQGFFKERVQKAIVSEGIMDDDAVADLIVEQISISELVRQNGPFDIIAIDVEGFDYDLIECMDFSSPWAPTVLVFEAHIKDKDRHRSIENRLQALGYSITRFKHDVVAMLGAMPGRT